MPKITSIDNGHAVIEVGKETRKEQVLSPFSEIPVSPVFTLNTPQKVLNRTISGEPAGKGETKKSEDKKGTDKTKKTDQKDTPKTDQKDTPKNETKKSEDKKVKKSQYDDPDVVGHEDPDAVH